MRLLKSSPHFRLTRGSSWKLEIAFSVVSAKLQPHGIFHSGRRCVETSGDEIEEMFTIIRQSVELLSSQVSPNFHVGPDLIRVADSSSRNAVGFSSARTTNRFPSSRCASKMSFRRAGLTRIELVHSLERVIASLGVPFCRCYFVATFERRVPLHTPRMAAMGHITTAAKATEGVVESTLSTGRVGG